MALTDHPLPADLAFPGGTELLTDAMLEAFEREALALADDAGIDPAAAVEGLRTIPEEGAPVAARSWQIADDGAAEWALRKLQPLAVEQAEIEEQAQAWIAEIVRWKADRLAPLAARRAFFEGALSDYLRRLREQDPKCKSRVLPSGRIASTGSGPKVAIADEAAVIAWAREHLDGDELAAVVKVKESASIAELRKVATVEDRLVALHWTAGLVCGHEAEATLPVDGPPVAKPMMGEEWPCPTCDPEFGEQPARLVIELGCVEVRQQVVADNDSGAPVPGAVVDPARVSFRVELG